MSKKRTMISEDNLPPIATAAGAKETRHIHNNPGRTRQFSVRDAWPLSSLRVTTELGARPRFWQKRAARRCIKVRKNAEKAASMRPFINRKCNEFNHLGGKTQTHPLFASSASPGPNKRQPWSLPISPIRRETPPIQRSNLPAARQSRQCKLISEKVRMKWSGLVDDFRTFLLSPAA
jgi:hypothetical protein